MENTLEQFLDDIGFPNVIDVLRQNQISTLTALKYCDSDFLKEIGVSALPAKVIIEKLNSHSSPTVSSGNYNNNLQLTLLQERSNTEITILKKEIESQRAITDIQHRIDLMEMKQAADTALLKEKSKAEIDLLKKENEFNVLSSDLKRQIDQKENEGKLKVLETKLEMAKTAPVTPSIVAPPYWNSVWGPYSGIFSFPADTVLLNPQFYVTIQNWLGGPRHWVLRYRGSRNGFAASTFHSTCDGVGPTITIIRSTSGYLFGGYNQNSWASSAAYQPGGASFLFTLTNAYGNSPTAFYFKTGQGSYNHPSFMTTWGSGHDLHISNNCNGNTTSYSNFPSSYNDTLSHGNNTFAGSYNFQVSEIEVFTV
jgi:hypothetical protein